jgi:hypothetical protein
MSNYTTFELLIQRRPPAAAHRKMHHRSQFKIAYNTIRTNHLHPVKAKTDIGFVLPESHFRLINVINHTSKQNKFA